MRILIFNSVFYPTKIGGAEQSVLNLAIALSEYGHQIAVVSISENVNGCVRREIQDGIVCYYLQDLNFYWPFDPNIKVNLFRKLAQKLIDLYNFRYRGLISDIFNEFCPDIVHTNNLKGISALVWSIARRRKCRIIHTLRDYYLQCYKCSKRRGGKNCYNTCFICKAYSFPIRIMSRQVDHVVGISSFILDSHKSDGFFNKAKSSVIYNSITEGSRDFRNHKIEDLRIGYIGRIEAYKGIYILLERVKEIIHEISLRLIVAGNGNEIIINRLHEYDFVEYQGVVSVKDFFKDIDYLVVPSLWYEPMGRVVLESFAYGVPVLANKVGGLVELVDDGVTGVLSNICDQSEFKKDFFRLLSYDYSLLSRKCIERSRDFSNIRMRDKYLKALGC